VYQIDELVEAVTLDEVLAGRQCAFMKLDVEGAEPRVIRGTQSTIARSRPTILAELHDSQLRAVSQSSADNFIAQMASLGYHCSRLNADGTRGKAIERYGGSDPLNVVFDPAGEAVGL
jgi:hypothetical protein